MKIHEFDDGWSIDLEDTVVQMIRVDFRTGFLLSDSVNDLWVYLEQPFLLSSIGGAEDRLVPERASTLGPVLNLFNVEVPKISVTKSGDLKILFRNGYVLQAGPNENFESWHVLTSGLQLICMPGGEVAVYESRADGSSEGKLN